VDRVALSYEDDLDAAIDLLEAIAADTEPIPAAPSPRAFVEEFADDEVVVPVHYWIEPDRTDVLGARSAFLRAVKRRLEAADLEVSPPAGVDLQGRISVADVGAPADTDAD